MDDIDRLLDSIVYWYRVCRLDERAFMQDRYRFSQECDYCIDDFFYITDAWK